MPRTTVNKSQAIREYLSENPGAMPKVVVESLATKQIRVSPQMVSMIKSKSGAKKKQNGHIRIDQLIAAKVLVEKLGSVGEAKDAVSALAKLL